MPIIALILGAAELAYQHFVGIPDAERKTREFQEQADIKYQKALADYKVWMDSPIDMIPQSAIDVAMTSVKQQVKEQQAIDKAQALQDLSTRGVRTSGVSEYPLAKIRETGEKTTAQAQRDFQVQQLTANATEKARRAAGYG